MKFVKMPRGSNLCLYEKFLNECDKVFHRACMAGEGGGSQHGDPLIVVSVSGNANLSERLLD